MVVLMLHQHKTVQTYTRITASAFSVQLFDKTGSNPIEHQLHRMTVISNVCGQDEM